MDTPARNDVAQSAPAGDGTHRTETAAAARIMQRRELYWQNVIREVLSSLAAAAAASAGRLSPTPAGAAGGASPVAELFDGRLAITTRSGARLPIADVVPMFACSVSSGNPNERSLSAYVQCTVFQIRTPGGEIHNIPLHEITSFHALSDHLIRRLQEAANQQVASTTTGKQGDARPFGFAAFTSLAQAEQEQWPG